ncbi:hypothetical protein [Immundisolibacter sp.]|uniref:hypothetical protein n=1 Tax=Immundisolibacter sp. TaxID=1934948 RepID=UPI0035625F02
MDDKNRRGVGDGRRLDDRWTLGKALAAGFVRLTGSPTVIFLKWAGPCLPIWFVGDSVLKIVRELKNANTNADIQILFSGLISFNPKGGCTTTGLCIYPGLFLFWSVALALIVIVALLYAVRQKKLRTKVIHDMGMRIELLERYFDPRRSSSGLTNTGETNPGDE